MARPILMRPDRDAALQADLCAALTEAAGRRGFRLEALRRGRYPGRRLPDHALPGIRTVGYWDAEVDQTWGLPWQRNDGIELTFLENGQMGFAVDDREYHLRPDDLTVTMPWQLRRVGSPQVSAGRFHWLLLNVGARSPSQSWTWPDWLLLTRQDLAELTDKLRRNGQPVWRATAEVRRCFQAIAHAVETDQNGSNTSMLAVRINELFVLLLGLLRRRQVQPDALPSSVRRRVERLLAGFQTCLEQASQEWSVHRMADVCGVGTTQFCRHVRSLTNMTPAHYLNHCRLQHATRLLSERPDRSVTEVALACGFSSGQYFATLFAKKFGCSPRQFRNRLDRPHLAGDRELAG